MQNGKRKRGDERIEAHFFEEELPEYDYEEYEDPNFVYGGEDDLFLDADYYINPAYNFYLGEPEADGFTQV